MTRDALAEREGFEPFPVWSAGVGLPWGVVVVISFGGRDLTWARLVCGVVVEPLGAG